MEFTTNIATILSSIGKTIENQLFSSSTWLSKTFFFTSLTFFNTICFALALYVWSINRQTQIRPSKSQRRPSELRRMESKRFKKKHKKLQRIDEGSSFVDELDLKEKKDEEEDVNENDDFFHYDDLGYKSREKMIKNFSMDFSDIIDQEDIADTELAAHNDNKDDDKYKKVEMNDKTSNSAHLQKMMRDDMLNFVATMNVFSYLSDDAFKEILPHMKYIDLPKKGSPIMSPDDDNLNCCDESGSNRLDGSLYAVITGSVDCCCQFVDDALIHSHGSGNPVHGKTLSNKHSTEMLRFTVESGHLITSQLAMLSDLVRQYQQREGCNIQDKLSTKNSKCKINTTHPIEVNACTAEDDTRLICVPSSVFLTILDKFPGEVYQIAQSVFGRLLRVTIQTLVKNLGFEVNEIVSQTQSSMKEEASFTLRNNIRDWTSLLGACKKECTKAYSNSCLSVDKINNNTTLLNISNDIERSAATLAAWRLGTTKKEDIDCIQQNSSIVAIDPGCIILRAGRTSKYVYFVIDGELEVGDYSHLKANKNSLNTFSRLNQPLAKSLLRDVSFDADDLNNHYHEDDKSYSFKLSHKVNAGTYLSQLSAFAGEVSIVTARSSVKRKDPTYLLQLSKSAYLSLVSNSTTVLIQSLDNILKHDFSSIAHLLDWGVRWTDIEAGSILANKKEPAKSLWVVLNGRLRSGVRNVDGNIVIKEHGRGACIGDVQVLTGDVWPHDVYAVRNSELAEIPLLVLDFIMNTFPACGVHFAKVIANQVNQSYLKKDKLLLGGSDNRLPSYKLSVATITILPLCFGSETDDVSRFCQSMISGLEKIAPCALVTKDLIKKKLGKAVDSVKNVNLVLKLARVLGDLEENNRLNLYQADSRFNGWTKTCIEHSDSVVLLIDSKEPPDCDKIINFLSHIQRGRLTKRIELVIFTEEENKSNSSGAVAPVREELHEWIEHLPFSTSLNMIRMSDAKVANEADVTRMCRRITGCSLGLALGGGGARGIAHLGVIKALLDMGISVDLVGGVSQGAFIGALFAKNPDNFEKLVVDARLMAHGMASVKEKIFDLTLPLVSYFDGRRFNRVIEKIIGPKTKIEYLQVKYMCISTDLRNCCHVAHKKGSCWKYVRASMSLQGYLPPISENGSLLLDGGYSCYVPNEVMIKEMQPRAVIAVDVSPEEMPTYYEYGSSLSGFWLLWNSWNPFVKTVRVASMGELSQRLIWVNSSKQQQRSQENSDLFISPPVHEYGTLDFHLFDEIYQLGYDYAKPRIEEFIKHADYQWVVPTQKNP